VKYSSLHFNDTHLAACTYLFKQGITPVSVRIAVASGTMLPKCRLITLLRDSLVTADFRLSGLE